MHRIHSHWCPSFSNVWWVSWIPESLSLLFKLLQLSSSLSARNKTKGDYMNYSSNLIMNGERKHRYYVLYRIAASLSPLCGRVAAGGPRHLRHPLRRRRLLLSSASGEPLSKRNERGRNNDTEHYWGKKYLENGILVNLKKMIANCTLSQHSQCQYATLSMSLIFVGMLMLRSCSVQSITECCQHSLFEKCLVRDNCRFWWVNKYMQWCRIRKYTA